MRSKRRRTKAVPREKPTPSNEPGVVKAPNHKSSARYDPDFCGPGFYTRKMMCSRLGLTDAQFRALISSGLVHSSKKNPGGRALYAEGIVQLLLHRKEDGSLVKNLRPDALAAITQGGISRREICYTAEEGRTVFKMIEQGLSYARIAIETGLHAQLIMAIVNDYVQLEGSFIMPKTVLEAMNKVSLPGNFPLRSATDILEVLQAAEQDRICPECEKRPSASACSPCAQQRVLARLQAEARARQQQEKVASPPAAPASDPNIPNVPTVPAEIVPTPTLETIPNVPNVPTGAIPAVPFSVTEAGAVPPNTRIPPPAEDATSMPR